MALDTYANLQTTIIDWAQRTGDTAFTAAVPDFIVGAEQLMNYGAKDANPANSIEPIRCRYNEDSETIAITSGAGSLPSDYLQWRAVIADSSPKVTLDPVPPDFGASEHGVASTTAHPRFFDIQGSTITTYQSSSSDIILKYYAKVPALSDSATSNWVLTHVPMLYVYGSLIASTTYMMDDNRLTMWVSMYKQLAGGLNNSDVMARYARAPVSTRGATP
jgi:hypothetical protein